MSTKTNKTVKKQKNSSKGSSTARSTTPGPQELQHAFRAAISEEGNAAGTVEQNFAPAGKSFHHSILSLVHGLAVTNATLFCEANNLKLKVMSLQSHLIEETIPEHINNKFKNVLLAPHEATAKALVIKASIEDELRIVKERLATIKNDYEVRQITMSATLDPVLKAIELPEDSTDALFKFMEAQTLSIKTGFIIKQLQDLEIANKKKAAFETAKKKREEVEVTAATSTDIARLQQTITALQKQIKDQGNGKGAARARPSAAPQQKKKKVEQGKPKANAKKNAAGNKQGSAKAGKSRGQNGN